jgi:fatty acid desaturase
VAAARQSGRAEGRSGAEVGQKRNRALPLHRRARMGNLLWLIIIILVSLWLLGFFAVHIGGNLIHILLVVALILLIYRLATGRRVV